MSAPSLRSTPIGIAHAARTAVLVAGALSGLGSARAQSLLELYDAAHGFDATYLSARALAESVPYRIEQAEALLRPSASLGTSASRVELNPPIFQSYGSNTLALTLSGRQPLFNRANEATVRQAEKSLDVSLADLDSAEQELILRLSQAYFEVLGAQDTLATTRTNKAAISEQLASAKRNFEVGTATITDTREAQARFDLASAQEIAAQNDLVTKRIALDQLVGRPNVEPKQLAVPVALPAVQPDNADAWVRLAEGQHPAIRRAQSALEIARLETAKARAAALPTIDAVGSVSGGPRRDRRLARLAARQQRDRERRGPAQHAALHRRADPEPHQGNAGPRGPLAERPRSGPAQRQPGNAPGLLHAAVRRGPGAGARSGRIVEPARARGDAARLPRRRACQPRRAERADPAVSRPAATSPAPATRC
jgi:outer membrane protein TolC